MPQIGQRYSEIFGFLQFLLTICLCLLHISVLPFDLTKKTTTWTWTPACEATFTGLQRTLTTSPVLILPDYDKAFTLITNTSDYTTGTILKQEDALGRSHLVAYYSKSLQPVERNYEIHDKELLAIIHALRHFCHYLQGNLHLTKIFSDHANLWYFTTK